MDLDDRALPDDQKKEAKKIAYRIYKWLSDDRTKWQMVSMVLVVRQEERLSYAFMANTEDATNKKRIPGMSITIDELEGLVDDIQAQLLDLLFGFGEPDHISTLLFEMVGVEIDSLFENKELMLYYRRQVKVFSAGNLRRLVLKLKAWPLRLRFLRSKYSIETRTSCATAFVDAPECDLSVLCRRLRSMFPTVRDLLGPLVEAIIENWLKCLIWTIFKSEWSHSAYRGGAASEGGGRCSDFIARDHFLRELCKVHEERCNENPLKSASSLGRSGLWRSNQGEKRAMFLQTLKLKNDGLPQITDVPAEPVQQHDSLVVLPIKTDDSAPADGTAPAVVHRKSGSGGSPLQAYMRDSLKSLKRTAGSDARNPNGNLSKAAMEQMYEDCRKRFVEDPSLRAAYQQKHDAQVKARKEKKDDAPAALQVRDDCCNSSHWAAGLRNMPISPAFFTQYSKDNDNHVLIGDRNSMDIQRFLRLSLHMCVALLTCFDFIDLLLDVFAFHKL
jgi:hypothetical protein